MKRVALCTIFLFFAITNICLAVNFVQEWSVTQTVLNWDISHSGKFIGLINDDSYQILNCQGTIIKQGKNIWRGDWIRVSEEMFLIGNGIDGINRVYSYTGELISSQDCWVYSCFSPTGKYIFSGCGDNDYTVYQKDGTILYDRLYFSSWEPLHYSQSERYIATPYHGLFRVDNNQMIQVLEGSINYATFAGDEDLIILEKINQDNNQTYWTIYDQKLKLLCTKEIPYGKIYGFKSGYVIVSDKVLTFCNLENQIIAERSLSTNIQDVNILTNRDFFIVTTYDKFYLFDFVGKILAQIPNSFTDLFILSPTGDRLFTFNEYTLERKSKYGFGPLSEVTITSYIIQY